MKKGFFRSNKYLNIKDLLVITGMFLFMNIFAAVIVTFSLKFFNVSVAEPIGFNILVIYFIAFSLLIMFLLLYRKVRSLKDEGVKLESPFKGGKFSPSILLFGILLTLSSQIVANPFVELFPDSSDTMLKTLQKLGSYAILLTVFIAPVFEELVFRGVVLNDVRRSFGSFTAVVVSALLFSVVHLNMAQMLPAFLAGIVFGYVYIASGSIWAVIFLHLLNNALSYLLYIIMPVEDFSKPLGEIIQPQYIYYIIYVSAFVMLLGMVVRLIFLCRTDNKLRAAQVNNNVDTDLIIENKPSEIADEKDDKDSTKLTDTPFI
ncbi:MAG: type II CAAX endopeptidase family protein, partial [Rikenellaceae bacterium]